MQSPADLSKQVLPSQESPVGKKDQIEQMFDRIAPHYDFLNHFLSLGIDRRWRRRALTELSQDSPRRILDVATGTADLAIEAVRQLANQSELHVTGIDLSEDMLLIGRDKVQKLNLQDRITLERGDGEAMKFDDNSFDAITVGFGLRNFEMLEGGLTEIYRVLKQGCKLVILEFADPPGIFGWLFRLYFYNILPLIGSLVSKDNKAYTYLPRSVQAFPNPASFCALLEKSGFNIHKKISLSLGVCRIYVCEKP